MATYYAVGTGNWSGSSTTWATSSGGAAGAHTPTSSDNVVFDVHSTGTVTVAGTSGTPDNCNNMTMTSPGAGHITMGSTAYLNIAGSMTLATGMTFSPNAASTLNFTATSTGQTLTTAGYNMPNVIFNGVGGGWTLQDNFNNTAANPIITLTNGALNTNNVTIGSSGGFSFSSSNANTRSLTLGTTNWKIWMGTAGGWNISTSTGMTLSAASSTLTLNAGTATGIAFAGGGLTYGTVTSTSLTTGSVLISGANTFSTLTLSAAATTKTTVSGYALSASQTVTGTFTSAGNSLVLRNFIYSSTVGTQYTLSAGTYAITNTDLRDIASGGAGNANISATSSTTGNGDCGGNSGWTFQASRNVYMVTAASVNWSAANWCTTSGGVTAATPPYPLPQDTAIFDANSITAGSLTITLNEPRVPSTNWTGVTNTPAFAQSAAAEVYGSMILVSGMTYTGAFTTSFLGRGSYSLDGGTLTWPTSNTIIMNAPGGTLSLAENLTSNAGLQTNNGTFALNGYNFSGTTIAPQGGTISGTGTITGTTYTQTGGSVTLGGLLTLTGAAAISGGTLDMNDYNETGATTLAVSAGTLNLSGQFLCSSTITVSGGTVANTGSSGELKTTGNSLITFSGGTSTCMKVTEAGTSNIVVSGTGSLTIPALGMISWTSGLFEVTGSTAFFSTGGAVTGTNSTLTVGTSSGGGGDFTFG